MDRESVLRELKKQQELNPDKHDGSYELMRAIVAEYAKLGDYSRCTYKDLDAIYYMAIGTWAFNVEQKKDRIKLSCLNDDAKERLCQLVDVIWDNACESK